MARNKKTKTLTVISSITRSCLLKCRYCFAIDPSLEHKIMSLDILESIIKNAFSTGRKKIAFEWTGGECLLAGRSFFEKIVELQTRYHKAGINYTNSIQTSGCIYDEPLFDYLISQGFHLGVSLDGPEDLHNANRPLKSGEESFKKVLRTFTYLNRRQDGGCGAVATVSKASLGREREIIEFFRGIGLRHWHCNHYLYDSMKANASAEHAISPEDYANHYINMLEAYLAIDDQNIDVTHVSYLMKGLMAIAYSTPCSYGGACVGNFINIDPFGNTAICPKFMGHEGHNLGNIKEHSISWILSRRNPRMKKYQQESDERIERCEASKCQYLGVCNGACPYESFIKSNGQNISAEPLTCESRKHIFEYVNQRLMNYGITTVLSKNNNLSRNRYEQQREVSL